MYITTPIYYVNGKPHLGSVYTTLVCDVLARFYRNCKQDVWFLTGTDEHGQKIEQVGGDELHQFVDGVSSEFKSVFDYFNVSYNDFIRTTEKRHFKAVQFLWKTIESYIYLGSYSGYYSIADEAFYDKSEIIDNKAPSGSSVEWVERPSYFFKLSAFQDKLLQFYEENPDFIQPESRRNEVISFVKGGLKDLSISRTNFSWGIPVPGDPKHIIYVWLDALTNYITALDYPNINSEKFQRYWKNSIHIVGKDILRFHAVYWPAFLMAANLPLPKKIFAHGWWTVDGEKMSKSRGNVINPIDMADKYGKDAFRYFLLREVSFGKDGDFSEGSLIKRYNSELANAFGNLVSRVFSFLTKKMDNQVPEKAELTKKDQDFLEFFDTQYIEINKIIDKKCAVSGYAEIFFSLTNSANQYVDAEKPWILIKNDLKRFQTVIYVLLSSILKLAIIGEPLLPDAMKKILGAFDAESFDVKQKIPFGKKLRAIGVLFPKIEEKQFIN